jgi:hypothetical protein
MLRITTALIALTLTAGIAQIAPVATLDADGLVVKVANDATSENDEPSRSMGAEPNDPGGADNEAKQFQEEGEF